MNRILVEANVYYLPLSLEADSPELEPEWPSFTSRLRNAWWRLRLALAEMRGILGARPRRCLPGEDYEVLFDESDVVVEEVPRRSTPARVIDFESARQRLRPASRD